jgi:hypothetical protein
MNFSELKLLPKNVYNLWEKVAIARRPNANKCTYYEYKQAGLDVDKNVDALM